MILKTTGAAVRQPKTMDQKVAYKGEYVQASMFFYDFQKGDEESPTTHLEMFPVLNAFMPRRTPVLAVCDGVIGLEKDPDLGGYVVSLKCPEWTFMYQLVYTLNVKDGDTVKQGQTLGSVGRASKDYNMHFLAMAALRYGDKDAQFWPSKVVSKVAAKKYTYGAFQGATAPGDKGKGKGAKAPVLVTRKSPLGGWALAGLAGVFVWMKIRN
jgi:hypothetical protein